jgi:hypothetical protein
MLFPSTLSTLSVNPLQEPEEPPIVRLVKFIPGNTIYRYL